MSAKTTNHIFLAIIVILTLTNIFLLQQKYGSGSSSGSGSGTISATQDFFKTNKTLLILLMLEVVIILVYYWLVYREYKKKEEDTQEIRTVATCPDYWDNVSSKDKNGNVTLKCRNTQKLGKFYLQDGNNTKDFSSSLYEDPVNKCRFAKHVGVTWEGVDHLCPDKI